nr:immunoglobulin light chain junction region [Macaca mulatta]MPO01398.1 immunoglobulin light chain junction region [Macaca mulatta]MPO02875.1 immunoglobulin light chain junction region [Macaca mulatta]
CQQESNWQTF